MEVLVLSGSDRGTLEERFWRGVIRSDGCWEWQRYCDPSTGYGKIADVTGYRKIGAHRASWLIHYGDIPEGVWVLHECDNRPCVNPEHLFLGTCADNVSDMWKKGRGSPPPRGAVGMGVEESRRRNRRRMGLSKSTCKRGHDLPEYREGTQRTCYETECADARRYNSLGNKGVLDDTSNE